LSQKPDSDTSLMSENNINNITQTYTSSRLQTKLGVAFSVLAVIISALLTFASYLNFRAKSRGDIRQRLGDIVSVAALQINGDEHSTLVNPAQEGGPAYMRIKRVLQSIRDRVPDLRFIYTWRQNPDGKIIFVVDAETDPNEISHLGDAYDSGEPALLSKLKTLDSVTVDEKFTTDKWGVWLSGYAPFYRSDGQMEGILGVDIKASKVLAYERRYLWMALKVFSLTVPLTLLLGLWFGRRLAAPIVKLTIGSRRIAEGDLSHRVSVRGDYETDTLAQSFNTMTDTLQKAIVYRDEEITNRKKAEKALDAANKDLRATVQRLSLANRELGSFAYITSHDLKTPAHGIKMLTDWITADHADEFDDKGKENVELLKNRVSRLYNYIDAIHQYTSIGYLKENKVIIDLNDLISQVISNFAPHENIEIKIKNKLPVIECEKSHIRQVFRNLLDNAIKYMDKPQGKVVVSCVEESGCWKFGVADNGPGIDEKYHGKIFEIFQTLSTKDQSETTGVGLSIVKKVVELYGGKVWVQSRRGRGTTFYFTLPKQSTPFVEQDKFCVLVNDGPRTS
jgi:signal transduction histidine kinase